MWQDEPCLNTVMIYDISAILTQHSISDTHDISHNNFSYTHTHSIAWQTHCEWPLDTGLWGPPMLEKHRHKVPVLHWTWRPFEWPVPVIELKGSSYGCIGWYWMSINFISKKRWLVRSTAAVEKREVPERWWEPGGFTMYQPRWFCKKFSPSNNVWKTCLQLEMAPSLVLAEYFYTWTESLQASTNLKIH